MPTADPAWRKGGSQLRAHPPFTGDAGRGAISELTLPPGREARARPTLREPPAWLDPIMGEPEGEPTQSSPLDGSTRPPNCLTVKIGEGGWETRRGGEGAAQA